MGLGFFAEVHLFSMRVGLIRLILLAGFLFVATISLANAAHEAVLSRVGEPTNISPLGLAAAGAPNSLKSLLPGGGRDAFFQPLKQVASWTASPPKLIAALWPGLNHWLLFLLILAPIGLIPPAVGLLFRWHLTRGAVEEAEGKVDRPPATEEQKPPPAAGEADDTKPAES